MNWLAHAFLSKPDIEFRLGNVLADLVKGRDRAAMTAGFLDGVRRHQAIDVFTDSHPVVRRSRARIEEGYKQVTGMMAGPPANVLQECARRIEREAGAEHQTDLLGVSQLMTELRFSDPEFFGLFGGRRVMTESPMLQKWLAENLHEAIEEVLRARFKTVPHDLLRDLQKILNERKLKKLNVIAAKCPDLDAFRTALTK